MEFLGMLQVVVLVLFPGFVEAFEGFHADVDILPGFGFQRLDGRLSGALLAIAAERPPGYRNAPGR